MTVTMTMDEYKELEINTQASEYLRNRIRECAEYKESGMLTVNQDKALKLVRDIVEDY